MYDLNDYATHGGTAVSHPTHMNIIIITLNWLHLGKPSVAPYECRLGRQLNQTQLDAPACLEHIATRLNYFTGRSGRQ